MTMHQAAGEPVVVERVDTPHGELALRRAGEHFEIISNGCFLMDTRAGESERLLVRAALAEVAGDTRGGASPGVRVLVGGLGVGFSLAEALSAPSVAAVDVVEREPAVLAWQHTHLARFSGHGLADPRTRVVRADLVAWLLDGGAAGYAERQGGAWDVVCLDIDNGPDWTVTGPNARLYGRDGIAALHGLVREGGVLAVWSASASESFAVRLGACFTGVRALAVPVAVPRGEPDVVYLARR